MILSNGRHRIKRMKEFNEKNFGDWQGMEIKEIYRKYPVQAEFYFNDIKNYNSKEINAESLEHALRRFVSGVKKIEKSVRNGNVLVVSHGTILKLFFNYIDNKNSNLEAVIGPISIDEIDKDEEEANLRLLKRESADCSSLTRWLRTELWNFFLRRKLSS